MTGTIAQAASFPQLPSAWTYRAMRRTAVESPAASRYRHPMPNRKTFDPREKYDHSGRPVEHAQRNDLKPDISEEGVDPTPASPRKSGDRVGKPPAPR